MYRVFLVLLLCAGGLTGAEEPVIKVDAAVKAEKVQFKADVFVARDADAEIRRGREAATKEQILAAMVATRRYLDLRIAEMGGEKVPEAPAPEKEKAAKPKVEILPVEATNSPPVPVPASNVSVSYQPPLPEDADTKNYTWTWEDKHWLRRPVPGAVIPHVETIYHPVSTSQSGG